MSKFRIRKGDREYTASRLETLQELASRGLLLADDPVSVDMGAFQPAGDLEQLTAILASSEPAEDPWRHWGDVEQELDDPDDVLNSFLDQLASGSMPSVPEDLPTSASQPLLTPVEPEPLDPPELEPEPLDASALEPEPLDASALEPEPEPERQADPAPLASEEAPSAPRPELRLVDPDGSEVDSEPVSFSDWIEQKGSGDGGRLLENFGRYDDGVIIANRATKDLVNWWRVLMLAFLGASAIGFYTLWIRTAATTPFPPESELANRVPGGFRDTTLPEPPIKEGAVDEREVELAARTAADRALRNSLKSQIIHFSNKEGLEDALFQELLNVGGGPLSVEVDVLELRGGTELGEVPVRSNVMVKLAAPRGAEYGDEVFQTRLKTAWLVLGKYQSQGKIRFGVATVVMADPLPWDEPYEGKKLLSLWNGQVTADALFLDNR